MFSKEERAQQLASFQLENKELVVEDSNILEQEINKLADTAPAAAAADTAAADADTAPAAADADTAPAAADADTAPAAADAALAAADTAPTAIELAGDSGTVNSDSGEI